MEVESTKPWVWKAVPRPVHLREGNEEVGCGQSDVLGLGFLLEQDEDF